MTSTTVAPRSFKIGGASSTDTEGSSEPRKKRSYPVIPAGKVVNVEVVDVVIRQIPPQYVKFPDRTEEVNFHFKVIDGQWEGSHIWGKTSTKFNFNENCRFRLWIQAILGVDTLPEDFDLQTTVGTDRKGNEIEKFEMFEGMFCRVEVGNYDTPSNETRHVVDNVLPYKENADLDADDIF